MSEQKCPICSTFVTPSARYPEYVSSGSWARAADENGRHLEFGFAPDTGYCIVYSDTHEPRQTGICFIDGVRCWAGEDYWGGSVVAYPYDGEK
jgi:hypothetical protein